MQVLQGSTKEKKQKCSKTFVPPNVVTMSASNTETEDDGETESPTQKAGEGGTNGNESSPMVIQTSRGSNSTEDNVLVLSERGGIDNMSYNLFTGLVAKFSIEVLTLVLSLVSVVIVHKGALKEKRNVHKPTMGYGVHEWSRRNGGAKMPIDFTPGMRRPTDPVQAAKLSSECGIQIRSKMPVVGMTCGACQGPSYLSASVLGVSMTLE
jgi:hypothetical protein